MRRRGMMVLGVIVALAGVSGVPGAAGVEAAQAPRNADRAARAYTAMQSYFATDRNLYLESYPYTGGNRYSYLWPYSQAMGATIDMWGIPGAGPSYRSAAQTRQQALAAYWNATRTPPAYASYVVPPLGPGGDRYYDDNDWAGIDLIRLYRMSGSTNTAALGRARQLFTFAVSGWDTNPASPAPGGVYWVEATWNRDRNTVSTAPAAELGAHLYEITRDPYYLDWAKRMYAWTRTNLLAPNGLYWDHIRPDGSIETAQWSYNQGTMVGAGVLLARITGDASYLAQATATANAALTFYAGAGYFSQPAAFNAIFFRNLLLLHTRTNDGAYLQRVRQAMQGYADQAWTSYRDPRTNLIDLDRSSQGTHLLDQAAMVAIFACLAWDTSQYGNLT